MANKPRKKAEDALLLALACGATVECAARQCGLCERTVYRRLEDPDFKQRLQQLRTDMIQRTAGALTAASTESVIFRCAWLRNSPRRWDNSGRAASARWSAPCKCEPRGLAESPPRQLFLRM